MKRRRFSIQARFFLAFAAMGICTWLLGSSMLYIYASKALRYQVRERVEAIASTTAANINAADHNAIRTRADESTSAYKQIKSILKKVRNANPETRYIYTMRKTSSPNALQFVVDAEDNPKDISHVGDRYDASKVPWMMAAFSGPSVDAKPNTDKWGTWLSGYAPILDDSGRAVGIVGVDMSIAQASQEDARLRRAAIICVIAIILIASMLSLLFTKPMLRPIAAFIEAARRIRQDDLDVRVDVHRHDEINDVANAFNRMACALKDTRKRL
ncbi:MAG TPA: HAMP domain-containing protein, partial [Armatimonadota bacterium]